jgi:hypothetical protein
MPAKPAAAEPVFQFNLGLHFFKKIGESAHHAVADARGEKTRASTLFAQDIDRDAA